PVVEAVLDEGDPPQMLRVVAQGLAVVDGVDELPGLVGLEFRRWRRRDHDAAPYAKRRGASTGVARAKTFFMPDRSPGASAPPWRARGPSPQSSPSRRRRR